MLGYLPYILCFSIIVTGLWGVAINSNYIKKLMSLGIMQSGVIMFFLALGKVQNGYAPILSCSDFAQCTKIVSNPLPQVLMLTAIVVGVATLAVGLALSVKVKNDKKSLEEDKMVMGDGK